MFNMASTKNQKQHDITPVDGIEASSAVEGAIADVIGQLEEIRDVPDNKYRRSIEGTLWMLKNRIEMVSVFLPSYMIFNTNYSGQNVNHDKMVRADFPLENASPESAKTSSFSCLSPLSTTDSSDTLEHGQYQQSSKMHDAATVLLPSIKQKCATPSLKPQWTPSSWFLRTNVHERRYSGDAIQYKKQFKKRCMYLPRRFRRRKTISRETLQLAAAQEHQVLLIHDSMCHHSNSASTSKAAQYRRSQSAVSLANVSAMTETPRASASSRFLRYQSLSSISGFPNEVWPESITGLLSGGQLLTDRSMLFSLLEEEVNEMQTRKSEQSYNGGNNDCCENNDLDNPKKTSGLSMISGGVSIPRPDKKWGGEDAFFISDSKTKFSGVADGVGEWGELGCNPRQFAEELMEGARAEASIMDSLSDESKCNERASIRAQQALAAGFRSTKSFGSSTAIVAGLDAEGRILGVANIGDSVCLVLRREPKRQRQFMPFRRTKEQQHFFNCPYQLSRVPHLQDLPQLESQGMHGLIRVLGSVACLESDTPDMADLYDIRVQEGDLVILGTDGVFDNLFDHEIAALVSLAISPREAARLSRILSRNRRDGILPHPNAFIPPVKHDRFGYSTSVQDVAQAVAEAAFYRSIDPRAKTPFARHSRKEGAYAAGGKMDDITCVAAWIV